MSRDSDEKERVYFRANSRVTNLNGQWYFSTRETELGPFASEAQAAAEGARHIAQLVALAKLKDGTIMEDSVLDDLKIKRDAWDGQPDT